MTFFYQSKKCFDYICLLSCKKHPSIIKKFFVWLWVGALKQLIHVFCKKRKNLFTALALISFSKGLNVDILFLQKHTNSLQDTFIHPPEPYEAFFIMHRCGLLGFFWTADKNSALCHCRVAKAKQDFRLQYL